MKIVSLATRNFRNLADCEWKLDGKFQVVKGPNEAGKSSVVDAILTALYGDATSSDKKYEAYRRWKSTGHIYVALDLALKVGDVKLERDFENGKNRFTFEGRTVQARDKVRHFLAEHLPLAAEESFRQTACVRQDEIKLDIDPGQLKRQLESSSLSSTGHDLANLEKQIDSRNAELRRGLVTAAPKNPGPIKILEDKLQQMRAELTERNAKETEARAALAEFEVLDAQVERLAEQQRRAEERQDLDRKYVDAEAVYKQRESDIADLTVRRARLQQLPELVLSAQEDLKLAEQSVREEIARQTQAQEWKARDIALKTAQGQLANLAVDVQKLERLDAQLKALANPLTPLKFDPADFARYHVLEQELSKILDEVGGNQENVDRLASEAETEKERSTSLQDQRAQLEQTIAKFQAELALAKQVHETKEKQRGLLGEHQTVSKRVDQIMSLDSDRSRYSQELETHSAVMEIGRKEFEDTVASARALEAAIQAEGIGLEIDPEQAVQITVQTDDGPVAEIVVGTIQKFAARRVISVHIPGLGRFRLTNESSTAQQFERERRLIAGALSRASASRVEDLLERFRQRDVVAAHLSDTDTKLQVVLDSRTKEDWKHHADVLTEQLNTISSELETLGSTREIQTVDKELSGYQKQLNQLEREHTESVTRLKMLEGSLSETRSTLRDRQQSIVPVQHDIEALVQRADQQDVTALQRLESQYEEYLRRVGEIQDQKARVLDGRLDADVRTRCEAERQNVAQLTEQREALSAHARDDNELQQLEKDIGDLNRRINEKRDNLAGLLKEKQMLEAEGLDKRYSTAVTQAAVADQNMKEYRPYAFATPGERIDLARELKALKSELENARNRRAELKVKSDSAGQNQERISELKEGISDCERRVARLKHQLDIDATVLDYLQRARTKALAELLAAIPTGVGNLLDRITAGKYQRVDGTGFDLRVWSDQKGEVLELQEMSGGTLDQFYISLRLEALRSIFLDDLPPLILDDSLVSCDPQRRSHILEILDSHSKSGQVIYLTCHDWPELERYPCLELT